MTRQSRIGWLYGGHTWNPQTGCTHVGPECDHCYADEIATDQQARGSKKYRNGFMYTEHPQLLDWPLHIKKPSFFFVTSMGDPFHEDASAEFIELVLRTIKLAQANGHTFVLLTKRPQIMARWFARRPQDMSPNLWLGSSVGVEKSKWRINHLRSPALRSAKVRLLSIEPLLEPLHLTPYDLEGIDWVIVGGESGKHYREMPEGEAQRIRDLCLGLKIPFFYKQSAGRVSGMDDKLDGVEWKQRPLTIIEKSDEQQRRLFI